MTPFGKAGLMAAAAALFFGATSGGPAGAETVVRAASAFGPAHMNAQSTYPLIFQKLEEFTEGRYSGEDYPSGLVAPKEMLNGLRDGIADMGAVVLLYFPADFVESALPAELSVLGSDPLAIAATTTEYLVTCAECQAEFAKAGQVYLGSSATAPYNILSKVEANSPAAFEKMRMRTSGSTFTAFGAFLGATTVQIPSSEVFEAMSQGTVDATFGALPELINGQLFEVVRYVTLTNLGVFSSDGVANVSSRLWGELAPADRQAFMKAVQYGAVRATGAWLDNVATATETGKAQGIAFQRPAPEVEALKRAFVEKTLEEAVAKLAEKGVADPAAKVARYRALSEKWHKLAAEAGGANDRLAEMRIKEIWSGVDFATYGQ